MASNPEKPENEVLQKFLRGNWQTNALKEAVAFIKSKMLTEFPIFALNDDYMKAIAVIISSKLSLAT